MSSATESNVKILSPRAATAGGPPASPPVSVLVLWSAPPDAAVCNALRPRSPLPPGPPSSPSGAMVSLLANVTADAEAVAVFFGIGKLFALPTTPLPPQPALPSFTRVSTAPGLFGKKISFGSVCSTIFSTNESSFARRSRSFCHSTRHKCGNRRSFAARLCAIRVSKSLGSSSNPGSLSSSPESSPLPRMLSSEDSDSEPPMRACTIWADAESSVSSASLMCCGFLDFRPPFLRFFDPPSEASSGPLSSSFPSDGVLLYCARRSVRSSISVFCDGVACDRDRPSGGN
mmetsp:Transcript_28013/g.70962  ORF Transcript_28013/g.70962 Transcript_28013/m.70962 type:complete len:288 (-) Transcript_28013:553-1416(-)